MNALWRNEANSMRARNQGDSACARMFFFEKKNQKTFIRLAPPSGERSAQRNESLFASFSSEKEVLPS
jgi:hypothetical protein